MSCSIEITSNGGDALIFDIIIIIIIAFWQRIFALYIIIIYALYIRLFLYIIL